MQKLNNPLQYYAWGSKTALTELYGIANPRQQPMAELWMGAHPKSSSSIEINGESRLLRDVIAQDKTAMLGAGVAARFGELPFLFKVLCAAQPLSIQVHPGKAAAEAGFARENAAGIPLSAAERNYKDANHKPELVYALTPFQALNGFRELHAIVSLLEPVAGAHRQIAHFIEHCDEANLASLFTTLLSLQGKEKSLALDLLKATGASRQGAPWETIRAISAIYPDDNGLFAPLLMNVLTLQPGDAMFLFAETPHAYLNGVALEVMANSDNVLRAGLTEKYIDIPELLANLKFEAIPEARLLLRAEPTGAMLRFPVPVEDFAFAIHVLQPQPQTINQRSAAILFCIEGEVQVTQAASQLTLQAGESCFVPACEAPVAISGRGRLARVFNDLS